jgi:hypothetical protein
MIFRRRRTRIEIEQSTVTVTTGDPNSVAHRPVTVAPPAPVESVLARVLPFPAPEPTEPNATPSVPTIDASHTLKPTAKETRS